jgi:hypothetical protein
MLKWMSAYVKIGDLKDYDDNPRTITKKDMASLVASIKQDGYHQRLLVNKDLTIIGGHQRKRALLIAGFKDHQIIEVLMPSEDITEDQFKRINVRDNLPFGKYDFDMIANMFDMESLVEWGMPQNWMTEYTSERKSKCECGCCNH